MTEIDRMTVRIEADTSALTRELERAAQAQSDFARQLDAGGQEIQTALADTDALAEAARGLTGAFTGAFRGAALEGRRLADVLAGLERDILRILTRSLVVEPLSEAISSTFVSQGASLLAGLFHRGGEVGAPGTARRSVPAATFAGAPRYALGGLVARAPRLAPGEVPAILHRGEVVRTPAQETALQRRLDGEAGIVFQPGAIVIQAAEPRAFAESRGQIEAVLVDAVRRGRRFR